MILSLLLGILAASASSSSSSSSSAIEVYDLGAFPNEHKVAMHMPCEESNVFPTKCMCHMRCSDPQCANAANLCRRYESRGCRYLIMRGNANNKFATLKRTPTPAESAWFNTSTYEKTATEPRGRSSGRPPLGPLVGDLVKTAGAAGERALKEIFHQTPGSDGKHCGKLLSDLTPSARAAAQQQFLRNGVSLVALSYRAPKTLLNSMRSWQASGLLDWMTERIAILNDPLPVDLAIAESFGFFVLQPKDIPQAKIAKKNVLTIGAAFYYALQIMRGEYLLFLENDFKMDLHYPLPGSASLDLLGGLGMLEQGAQIVRLQSRSYQGCGNFLSCQQSAEHIHSGDKKRNWYSFYCAGSSPVEDHVSDCLTAPRYRCFSSWDTNWSLNAALMKKATMLSKVYSLRGNRSRSIPDIALGQFKQQDGLESAMVYGLPWAQWRVPMCISYQGLFVHEEVETAA